MTNRRSPKGNIQKIRPGVHRVRVSGGVDPIRRTRRQLSSTVRGTMKDAERRCAELVRHVEFERNPPSDISLNELFEVWDRTTVKQGRRRESTAYQDRRRYLRHVRPYLGDSNARGVKSAEVTKRQSEHRSQIEQLLIDGHSPRIITRRLPDGHGISRQSIYRHYRRGHLLVIPVPLAGVTEHNWTAGAAKAIQDSLGN